MSRGSALLVLAAVIVALILAIWPPFMLPDSLYQLIYGWRYPAERKCGDVMLIDGGPAVPFDRYTVDFGGMNLGLEQELLIEVCELPKDYMVLGLELEPTAEEALALETFPYDTEKLRDTTVSVSLMTENGETVVEHHGSLRDRWRWSTGSTSETRFLYGDGMVFTPAKDDGRYQLRVVVLPSDTLSETQAQLVLRGGGWK